MALRLLPALPLVVLLGGCQTGREVLAARLEVAAPTCATAPAIAPATAMTQKKKDAPFEATIRFNEANPCVADAAGNKGVYAVLDLPAGEAGRIVTVTSFAMGQTVFAPRLEFRDAQGALLREVGRDAFMFSGTSLQAQVRQREGERFLVIASDGPSVGKTVEQIQSNRVTSGTMVGMVYVPVNYGTEGKSQLVFAHNGEVTTTLAPVPKAD
jgi:hypothetical protein